MASTPKRVADRLIGGVKRYRDVLNEAKARDIGEADTVTVIKDMLADVFGYDKYTELTSEYAIRGTYCDLAIKLDGALKCLIEVKAIGIDLNDSHVRQAINYAANQGVDWALLTNGVRWRIYHVVFGKPITHELVMEVDFCTINTRLKADIDTLYLWCKEGWQRSALGEYNSQKQALSRFLIGAILQDDDVLNVVRRKLKQLSPDVRIHNEQIQAVLVGEVLKREVTEGDAVTAAKRKLTNAEARRERVRQSDKIAETQDTPTA